MKKELFYFFVAMALMTSSTIKDAIGTENAYYLVNFLGPNCNMGVQLNNVPGRLNLNYGTQALALTDDSFPLTVFSGCQYYAGSLPIQKPSGTSCIRVNLGNPINPKTNYMSTSPYEPCPPDLVIIAPLNPAHK